jgi:hypothetical protein
MLSWLRRLFKPEAEGGGYCEGTRQKCPVCDHWSSSAEPHQWATDHEDQNRLIMTCPNGHTSVWLDTGFMGLLVNIDPKGEEVAS